MSESIVCPNCGKTINKDECKTTVKLFYAYKTCCNCGIKFTKLHKGVKIFVYSYLVTLSALMIFALGIIAIYHYDKLTQGSTSVTVFMFCISILGVTGIIMNIFSYFLSKKAVEQSDNGFLPIVEDKSQAKLISFVNEKTFSDGEKSSLNYFPIAKENAVVLLPYPNISMKIHLNKNTCLDKLQLYDIYKIINNGFSEFVILTDYMVGDEVILYLKKFDDNEMTDNEMYDFVTLNNEPIGNVTVYKGLSTKIPIL